ncbi:hypothetical protein [Phyllobacterium sp. P30BS-XVII]|uniref:DUF6896 domain-containing protein n=1 Tax=Phyllobacterium sp. P30BS-XVII TaxID=2587046 RepID=UPI0013AF3EC7|nr:hypothetical protein [Phyllobacterium sp. P30BS-XVII]
MLEAFVDSFPNAEDFKYLLNFPRFGELTAKGETWRFNKHGIGLRFIRQGPKPKIVIEMHDNFGNSAYVDEWRFCEYLDSVSIEYVRDDITLYMEEHCCAE